MLSNCLACRYYGALGCAVQPDYWQMRRVCASFNRYQFEAIAPWLQPCPNYEPGETQTIEIAGLQIEI